MCVDLSLGFLFFSIDLYFYLCASTILSWWLWLCSIKLLEENIGKTLSDINWSRILYDPPPRILEIKAKINKWDLTKLKSFCTTKETISKVERQPSEWEKIIANEATDKELISKIYKQLLQFNSRKINDPIKKWAKELNRHFSKEDIIKVFNPL